VVVAEAHRKLVPVPVVEQVSVMASSLWSVVEVVVAHRTTVLVVGQPVVLMVDP